MKTPIYLTADEVAQRLRTTPINVIRLCRDGKIPATKPFGRWLISETDLDAHIAANRNEHKAAS